MTSAVSHSSGRQRIRSRPTSTGAIEIEPIGFGSLARPLWIAGAVASAGAGIIHLALGPEHVEALGALGLGFFVSAALQLGWAAVVALVVVGFGRRLPRPILPQLAASGIAINGAILAVWVVSRVVGLPAGETPWTPEAVGRPDAIAGVLEGLLVVGLAASLRGWTIRGSASRRSLTVAATVLAIGLMAIGTVIAVSPGETAHGHDDGPTHAVGEAHD